MAGIIAVAIKRDGAIRTVHLGKGALNMMRDVDFLTNPATHELWTRRGVRGGTPAPYCPRARPVWVGSGGL